MIKLTGGYRYYKDGKDFMCDDRDALENARIIRSLSDEEFEQLMREIKDLEEKQQI